MTLANVDGGGIPQGPTLGVTPTSLSYSLDYGAPSPVKSLAIANVGSGSSFPWQATVLEGGAWLLLNGTSNPVLGNTPGQVNVSVKTNVVAPGSYTGKIRISTTDSSVLNTPVDVSVSLTIRDPGFAAFPSVLTIWQKTEATRLPHGHERSQDRAAGQGDHMDRNRIVTGCDGYLDEKLAIGQATVTVCWRHHRWRAGPAASLAGVHADCRIPLRQRCRSSVKPGTAAGTYHGVIVIAAGDRSLPESGSVGVRDRRRRRPLPLHIPAAGN